MLEHYLLTAVLVASRQFKRAAERTRWKVGREGMSNLTRGEHDSLGSGCRSEWGKGDAAMWFAVKAARHAGTKQKRSSPTLPLFFFRGHIPC